MILRIYLDAKTCSCNIAYEQRLLEQLRWLDNKIRDNIDDKVRQKPYQMDFGVITAIIIGMICYER